MPPQLSGLIRSSEKYLRNFGRSRHARNVIMDFTAIEQQLETYWSKGWRVFTSSSFQTHSLVLLHIISRIDKSIPVYFINTGYHFPETIAFKERIAALFELEV